MKFYPIQFTPILKERIWGGTQLKSLLNKSVTDDKTGESWEISSVPNDVSIVASGSYKGKSLNDLISEFPTQLLGSSVYSRFGNQFPLLFKFIDAREDLSIQLHPNDELAQKRHNSFGKTEMWYVMHADEGARMIVGFKEKSSSEEYLKHLHDKSLLSILDSKKVKEGDKVYFINSDGVRCEGLIQRRKFDVKLATPHYGTLRGKEPHKETTLKNGSLFFWNDGFLIEDYVNLDVVD